MPKICILFFGLLRNLKTSLPTIRKNIFMSLDKQGISYDIYVHTYKLDVLNCPRAGEHNVVYNNNQLSLFQHPSLKSLVEDQNEVDQLLRFDEFLGKKNPWPEDPTKTTMKNLLRQHYSLKRVLELVPAEIEYDGYLFLRPDMIYLTPLPKLILPVEKFHFFSSPYDTYGGVNDRYCFTSRYGAEVYCSRLNEIYDEENVHSETFLMKHLLKYQMWLYPLKLQAYRIRANGIIKY